MDAVNKAMRKTILCTSIKQKWCME